MKTMRVLIIYEMIPEETRFYVLESVSNAEEDLLRNAHGKYVNFNDEEDYALRLEEMLHGTYDENRTHIPGKWVDRRVSLTDTPFEGPFDLVIHSGFGL